MTTFRDILAAYPYDVWSDGTLWYESAEMLATWDAATLDHRAVLRDVSNCRTIYLVNPLTGIELAGLALQMI
jgi:hypothetical protein